jgi:lysozyme
VYGTVGGKKARLPGLVARREATAELCRDWGRDGHFSQRHLAKE